MARSLLPSLFGGDLPREQADPFLNLQREVSRLFEDVFRSFGQTPGAVGLAAAPRMNISETDQAYKLEAELPGVSEDDIEVTLADDILTIRGEKKAERSETQESYHVMERSYGSFARSIRLPFAASPGDINASFRNGVLTITLPKAAAQDTSHRIAINKDQAPAGQPQSGVSGSQATH